jgi:hypothetical protein
MARCNRVTPFRELVDTGRGLVFGNRGCLHDAAGEITRPFRGTRWIACRLDFKARRRELLRPGRYTELFFLDDATALAAGHRPCRECRFGDYRSFLAAWHEVHPLDELRADVLDARLHAERVEPASRGQRCHAAAFATLPDGAFVAVGDEPFLILGDRILRWTPIGYDGSRPRPDGTATVLTPPSLLGILAAGWRPQDAELLHPSVSARLIVEGTLETN